MLANERVIQETARAYRGSRKHFPERLIEALQAGEAAGGDKRGRQSAALLVYSTEEYPISICVSTTTSIRSPSSPGSTTRRTSASCPT